MTFSNRFQKRDVVANWLSEVNKVSASSRSFDTSKYLYNRTANKTTQVSQFMENALNAAVNTIIGASNQSVVINGAGIQVGGDSKYQLRTIDFVGGSTQELVFHTFFSQNKKPFDLSSCTASFALINFVNKNGSPLIAKPMEVSKSEDGDGTVTNVLRVVLLPEETVDLVGKFIYQITIQDISGEIEIPDQGIIRIANNINKSFPH